MRIVAGQFRFMHQRLSRSLGITRRSRRARSMSYARRHSTNVCPGNQVRYNVAVVRVPVAVQLMQTESSPFLVETIRGS